jgi:hypothetical protein
MIFHQDFVKIALSQQEQKTAVCFQVGFLNASETKRHKSFQDYEIDFKSTNEATGLTMFPVKALQSINGFDEFYHFWGAEDTDVHVRLKNAGYKVRFFKEDLLMLHQWHESYRNKESKKLTSELRLSNAVKLNHQHLKHAEQNKITTVNKKGWGIPISQESYLKLLQFDRNPTILSTQKQAIDHFLFHQLPNIKEDIVFVQMIFDGTSRSIKYHVKKHLGKTVNKYYSLKDVNDMLLTHIISFYRDYDYIMEVKPERGIISLKIRKPNL